MLHSIAMYVMIDGTPAQMLYGQSTHGINY